MFKLLSQGRALLFSTCQLMHAQIMLNEGALTFSPFPLLLPVEDLKTDFTLSLCWKKDHPLPPMAKELKDALINDYPRYSDDADFIQALPHIKEKQL